jgi:ABC-type uncharacterized transport system substrate-binding protein
VEKSKNEDSGCLSNTARFAARYVVIEKGH